MAWQGTFRTLALLLLLDSLLQGSFCPLPGRAQAQQVAQRTQLLCQVSLCYYPVCGELLHSAKPHTDAQTACCKYQGCSALITIRASV